MPAKKAARGAKQAEGSSPAKPAKPAKDAGTGRKAHRKAGGRPDDGATAAAAAPEATTPAGAAPLPASRAPHASPARGPAPLSSFDPMVLVVVAIALAALPAVLELGHLALGTGDLEGINWAYLPLAAIVLPGLAIALAFGLLSGRTGHQLDEGLRIAAFVALGIGIAVVVTWGLFVLLAILLVMACQPQPQPCNVTCQSGSTHGSSCCGSQDGCSGSDSDGSGCCSASSTSGGGGGSGSCCSGSSSGPTVSGGGGSGKPAPAGGLASVGAGLGGALALRLGAGSWRDRFAHHPDAPAYAPDVYRVAGLRLCIGCFTTFPLFLGGTAVLAVAAAAAPAAWPWQPMLAAGLALASAQGISALGLATTKARKVLVKASLGAGLALAVTAIRGAPWPTGGKAAAMAGLAALAYASTLPRRRRMARLARGTQA